MAFSGFFAASAAAAWTIAAAVSEQLGVVTAGFFQSVGEDRQLREGTILVDGLSQLADASIVPAQPGLLDADAAQRIPERERIPAFSIPRRWATVILSSGNDMLKFENAAEE